MNTIARKTILLRQLLTTIDAAKTKPCSNGLAGIHQRPTATEPIHWGAYETAQRITSLVEEAHAPCQYTLQQLDPFDQITAATSFLGDHTTTLVEQRLDEAINLAQRFLQVGPPPAVPQLITAPCCGEKAFAINPATGETRCVECEKVTA